MQRTDAKPTHACQVMKKWHRNIDFSIDFWLISLFSIVISFD
jgi:hypothetical protein